MQRRPRLVRWFRLAAVAAALSFVVAPTEAANKHLEIPDTREATTSRAYRYANFTNEEAFAELDRRRIPYAPVTERLPGVRAPVRLRGKLHGVWIHSVLPARERETTPFEILDARLALALHDFCAILAHHDVVEVVHFTMYRPAAELREDPNSPQTRHPGGMAIDLGAIKKKNGDWLAIGPHWPAQIGAKTCAEGARKLVSRRGRELISIVCEAADQRVFHYMLTPHFNQEHDDHLHLEIKPEVKWFLVN